MLYKVSANHQLQNESVFYPPTALPLTSSPLNTLRVFVEHIASLQLGFFTLSFYKSILYLNLTKSQFKQKDKGGRNGGIKEGFS